MADSGGNYNINYRTCIMELLNKIYEHTVELILTGIYSRSYSRKILFIYENTALTKNINYYINRYLILVQKLIYGICRDLSLFFVSKIP